MFVRIQVALYSVFYPAFQNSVVSSLSLTASDSVRIPLPAAILCRWHMPLNNEASERHSRKSSHAYKPEKGGDK